GETPRSGRSSLHTSSPGLTACTQGKLATLLVRRFGQTPARGAGFLSPAAAKPSVRDPKWAAHVARRKPCGEPWLARRGIGLKRNPWASGRSGRMPSEIARAQPCCAGLPRLGDGRG